MQYSSYKQLQPCICRFISLGKACNAGKNLILTIGSLLVLQTNREQKEKNVAGFKMGQWLKLCYRRSFNQEHPKVKRPWQKRRKNVLRKIAGLFLAVAIGLLAQSNLVQAQTLSPSLVSTPEPQPQPTPTLPTHLRYIGENLFDPISFDQMRKQWFVGAGLKSAILIYRSEDGKSCRYLYETAGFFDGWCPEVNYPLGTEVIAATEEGYNVQGGLEFRPGGAKERYEHFIKRQPPMVPYIPTLTPVPVPTLSPYATIVEKECNSMSGWGTLTLQSNQNFLVTILVEGCPKQEVGDTYLLFR